MSLKICSDKKSRRKKSSLLRRKSSSYFLSPKRVCVDVFSCANEVYMSLLYWLLLSLTYLLKYLCFIVCHDALQKIITLLIILYKMQLHYSHIFLVIFIQHCLHSLCILILVIIFNHDLIKNSLWYFPYNSSIVTCLSVQIISLVF